MTSSSANKRLHRRGFTLIELLITIAIILVLMGILLPALMAARTHATRVRIAADLQGIAQALDAYRQDFRDYPHLDYSTNDPITATDRRGAVLLCWALLAPGPDTGNGSDGALGPGFRARGTQGQVYGPYINADKFVISGTNDWDSTIDDQRGTPYLYFPAFRGASIANAKGYVDDVDLSASGTVPPMYNFHDNFSIHTNNTFVLADMQKIAGDANTNSKIDPGETAIQRPYLLWSAGPDEVWGYDAKGKTDDVTNFN